MGKRDRQRKLARERYERWVQRRATRTRRVRQWTAIGAAGAGVIGLAVIGYFVFTPTGGTPAATSSAKPAATPAVSLPPATPRAVVPATPPGTAPVTHCTYTRSGSAARNVGLPPAAPDTKATYQATIRTNRGNIVVDLLNDRAPCTVGSFVYLAGKDYFSNTKCHRLTTTGIYVLQCGDPTGSGAGGPGYKFADENLAGATYLAGTLAMANAGPGTNGSQFFLVYAKSSLPPSYTPFGVVTSGLDVVRTVAQAGSDDAIGPGDGHPKDDITIEGVTLKKT